MVMDWSDMIDWVREKIADPIWDNLTKVWGHIWDLWDDINNLWTYTADLYWDLLQRLDTLKNTLFAAISDLDDKIWDAYNDSIAYVDTALIRPLKNSISSLWTNIGTIYDDLSTIVGAAQQEAAAWRDAVTNLDGALKEWVTDRVLDLVFTKLDEAVRELEGEST